MFFGLFCSYIPPQCHDSARAIYASRNIRISIAVMLASNETMPFVLLFSAMIKVIKPFPDSDGSTKISWFGFVDNVIKAIFPPHKID